MAFPSRLMTLVTLVSIFACFRSTHSRSYYVLHGVTTSSMVEKPIIGLARVRNFAAAKVYEKFQIVVRRSPFELHYSEDNVWAVKPSRMVADVIARALSDSKRFTAVARELGEIRPDFILGGELHAIEVYDSDDLWFAHLSLSVHLTRFSSGETLYTYSFDERKPLPERSFSQAARAISELLSTALDELLLGLESVDAPRASLPRAAPPSTKPASRPAKATDTQDETIFVPERR